MPLGRLHHRQQGLSLPNILQGIERPVWRRLLAGVVPGADGGRGRDMKPKTKPKTPAWECCQICKHYLGDDMVCRNLIMSFLTGHWNKCSAFKNNFEQPEVENGK
jgi:hypothetical protein